jgi:Nucleotidyl transferase AbiEii toxin, Type IV TA system
MGAQWDTSTVPKGAFKYSERSPGLDTLEIAYPAVIPVSQYTPPKIKLEFGGRSTGEPSTASPVVCDMAHLFSDFIFPTAEPRTMHVSRIFWEKATAIHVYCLDRKPRADHFSRHLHDIAKLHLKAFAREAIAIREVAKAVAVHKAQWFRAKDDKGAVIDYDRAVNGELILVPDGEALEALRKDYEAMFSEGLLHSDEAEIFDSVIDRCRNIQDEANRMAKATP